MTDLNFATGIFGENLTISDIHENDVCIGDHFRIGKAEVIVTQPRMPCYKLGLRFGRDDILKRFLDSRRSGFYFAVQTEGEIGAEDEVELLHRDEAGFTVREMVDLYAAKQPTAQQFEKALRATALPESWRNWVQKELDKL